MSDEIREEVESQEQVCSNPIPWWKRIFERNFRSACVDHDVSYEMRTGEQGDRTLIKWAWDELKSRKRADRKFLKDMLSMTSGNTLKKAQAYLAYVAVRTFGWMAWWT